MKLRENREIKETVKRLGQNRLRNHENMKSFIAQFFSDIDDSSPLRILQKFLNGELPEYDITLKQEATKLIFKEKLKLKYKCINKICKKIMKRI